MGEPFRGRSWEAKSQSSWAIGSLRLLLVSPSSARVGMLELLVQGAIWNGRAGTALRATTARRVRL